jgi:hypothetical protein
MSLGSSADVIPFTRFLERRQQRQVAAVNSNVVMPPSTDVGSQPDGTEPANADDGASPPRSTGPCGDPAWRHGQI